MRKNKVTSVRDMIVKYSKFVFPVIVIAVVAITVSVALNANNARAEISDEEVSKVNVVERNVGTEESGTGSEDEPAPLVLDENVPLTVNEDEQVQSIVVSYYNTIVNGDTAAMSALYDEVSDNDLLRCEETAKYLDYIPALEIYTKAGLSADARIVYVYYRLCFINHEEEVPGWQTFYLCTREDGSLYFKNGKNLTVEENEYITKVSAQDDVVEFNNRVSVEYNNLIEDHSELLEYLREFHSQVSTAIGVALAERNADGTDTSEGSESGVESEGGESSGSQEPESGEETPETPQPPAESGPRYATAVTTVNVRDSDSEQADKLGKVTAGTRLEVQEVRLNGWTKVIYEGKDGYIKSEFLNIEESTAGLEVIGTVTATANINVRSAAGQESESLGILESGSSLDLYAVEGEWCKVNYNGRVAYVKAEFVTQQ